MELRLPYERKKVTGKRAPWSTAQAQLEKIKSLHPLPGMLSTTHTAHSTIQYRCDVISGLVSIFRKCTSLKFDRSKKLKTSLQCFRQNIINIPH